MATALDVIRRAMRLIGALQEGEVPNADQASDGLVSLQAMLGEWETRGVGLGALADAEHAAADTVNVPVTHLNALALNLAVLIAPEYGAGAAQQAVAPQAERAFRALQAQYTRAPTIGADPAVVSQRGILSNGGYVVSGGEGALYSDTGPLYP